MGSNRERESPFQSTFFPEAGGFRESPFDGIREIVTDYQLYGQRPSGPIQIVQISDLGVKEVDKTVDPEFWLPVKPAERKRRIRLAGSVIILEGPIDPERRKHLIGDSSQSVRKGRGVVIVVEKGISGLSKEEKRSRADILEKQGFNKPVISERKVDGEPVVIWRARRPKARKRRTVDISGTRARFRVVNGLRETEEELARKGIVTVSTEKADWLLKNSGNVPRDARRIADGGGRDFETLACGCRLSQMIDGSWIVESCNTDSCVLDQMESHFKETDVPRIISFETVQESDHFISPQVNRAEVGQIITKRKGDRNCRYVVVMAELPKLDSQSRTVGWKTGKIAIRKY